MQRTKDLKHLSHSEPEIESLEAHVFIAIRNVMSLYWRDLARPGRLLAEEAGAQAGQLVSSASESALAYHGHHAASFGPAPDPDEPGATADVFDEAASFPDFASAFRRSVGSTAPSKSQDRTVMPVRWAILAAASVAAFLVGGGLLGLHHQPDGVGEVQPRAMMVPEALPVKSPAATSIPGAAPSPPAIQSSTEGLHAWFSWLSAKATGACFSLSRIVRSVAPDVAAQVCRSELSKEAINRVQSQLAARELGELAGLVETLRDLEPQLLMLEQLADDGRMIRVGASQGSLAAARRSLECLVAARSELAPTDASARRHPGTGGLP